MSDNKPNWDDAPDWAEWLAQDADGEWAWFREPPHLDQNGSKTWIVSNPDGQPLPTWVKAGSGKTNPNWRKTLEPKPDTKHQRTSKPDILIPFDLFDCNSISAMLDNGYRLEIDRHGLRGYKDDE